MKLLTYFLPLVISPHYSSSIINLMGYLLGFRFAGNLAMGINLETRRYKMFLTRYGVSIYSRVRFGRWDHLHLGLATLGTALALYLVIIGLHLLLQHEVCLPVAVLVLVYSYLSVLLLPSKVSVSLTAKDLKSTHISPNETLTYVSWPRQFDFNSIWLSQHCFFHDQLVQSVSVHFASIKYTVAFGQCT